MSGAVNKKSLMSGLIIDPKWIKQNPTQAAGLAAAAGLTAMTMGAASPLMAGAAAAGTGAEAAAGLGAAGAAAATPQMGAGLLGGLGGMGTQQAGLLAAQNAGLGLGADVATLNAAGTAGGGMATPWGVGSKVLGTAGKGMKAMQAANAFQPQQQPMSSPRDRAASPPPQDFDTLGGPKTGLLAGMTEEELKRLLMMKGMA